MRRCVDCDRPSAPEYLEGGKCPRCRNRIPDQDNGFIDFLKRKIMYVTEQVHEENTPTNEEFLKALQQAQDEWKARLRSPVRLSDEYQDVPF